MDAALVITHRQVVLFLCVLQNSWLSLTDRQTGCVVSMCASEQWDAALVITHRQVVLFLCVLQNSAWMLRLLSLTDMLCCFYVCFRIVHGCCAGYHSQTGCVVSMCASE